MVVLTVSVLLPDPGALKLANDNFGVIPPGWPETDNATLELNPPLTLTLRPTVALAPCITVIELVAPVSVKLRPEVTVSENVAFCVIPPPVAVTCTG